LLAKELAEASASLGSLSAFGYRLRNPHLLITPYLKKEAVLSSRIEGTRTSLSEVFLYEKTPTRGMVEDLQEVLNYVKALEFGLREIETTPINEALIKNMHSKLMSGVRGGERDPGRYKVVQNWIGTSTDILDAKFVPCRPESVPGLMQNLVEYLNTSERSPLLIKAGLMHYQFETIHPFRDGNGRMGRLLITLYLCQSKLLSQPLLYLSAYFEKNREAYDDTLFNASYKGDIEIWLKFFLRAVKTQADDALDRAMQLEAYRETCRQKLETETQTTNVLRVLDQLFVNPFIKINEVSTLLKTYYPTARNNILLLVDKGILTETTGRKRDQIFYAQEIGKILEI
jgi:Fic family protein